jgi:hypothetical protein
MPFTAAPPIPSPKPAGTGVSFSIRVTKRASAAVLVLTDAVQKQLFDGPIAGRRAMVGVGRGSDEGKLLVTLHDDGAFEFRSSIKGSVYLKCGVWDLLPKDKRPAASVKILSASAEGVLLQLPTWAKPSSHDGKLASEFGLKPMKRA